MSGKPTAIMCTSNGVGLGHLSRVMAIARHMTDDFDVVIFTLSAAVSIPVAEGFTTEYLRSHDGSGFDPFDWNRLLEQRLDHLHELYSPALVAFDGTHPYAGLVGHLRRHRATTRAWVRRGMWRAGHGKESIGRTRYFDLVVEPGDYAAEYDVGVTVTATKRVHRVAPIQYGGRRLTRHEARTALGLDPSTPVALVQLGAGQINQVGSLIRDTVEALRAAGVHVVVAASVLADTPQIDLPGVSVVQRYPISDYFDAFDLGFFAGGYNSFHEALALGLPAAFVPNLDTKLDDQAARTRFAHDRGYGLDWSDGRRSTLDGLVARLLDPAERAAMRAKMSELPPADGGAEAAALLRDAVGRR